MSFCPTPCAACASSCRNAIAAELRAVGVGQHLILGDRIDAEGRAELAGSTAAIPVVLHVGVVHQEDLTFRTRTRHCVLRLPAEELLKLSSRGRRRDFV